MTNDLRKAIAAVLATSCHHCGRMPEADGDHNCLCPKDDSKCLRHTADPVVGMEPIRAALVAHATAPLAADQPPVCLDHREAQHRDNKPPWCDSCGWRHGEPARRYGDGRVVA